MIKSKLYIGEIMLQLLNSGGGWGAWTQGINDFFMNGLGDPGLQGLATATMVIGIVGAVFAFVWHKLNQQSRLPGPMIFLGIAIVGGIASYGIEKPIQIAKNIGNWIMSLFGV